MNKHNYLLMIGLLLLSPLAKGDEHFYLKSHIELNHIKESTFTDDSNKGNSPIPTYNPVNLCKD